jgi:oligopeptide transport system substrate-binding protein
MYTFHLRKTNWSDGTPLTAKDFEFSWKRTLEPATGSEYSYQLYYVKNAREYNTAKIKNANEVGVKAKDDYTLVVTLENPTPFFLSLAAFHVLFPEPQHVISKLKPGEDWTRPEKMVSNGPYKLTEWRMNSHLKAVRNDQYWDAKNVKIDEIVFYPYENGDTEEKSFLSGKLDMTADVPLAKVPFYSAQKTPDSPFHSFPILASYY